MISVQRERNYSSKHHSRALIAILIAVFLTSAMTATMPIKPASANPGELHVGPGQTYATITAAIAAASPGDTIIVVAGTYDEQVVINKSLTIQGYGDTTIVKPSSAATLTTILGGCFSGGTKQIAGIIVANVPSGTSVTVKNLKVDGSGVTTKPTGVDYFAGIFYHETGGVIDSVNIVGGGAWSAGDRGYGVYLSAVSNTVSVEVKGSTITNYDKNGIDAHGNKLTVNIHDNTVTGRGPLPSGDEVQNGVLVMDDATGTVNHNTISNMAYMPETWWSAGVMFFDSDGSADSNTITDCQIGIMYQDGSGTATGNTVTGGTVGLLSLWAQYTKAGTWTVSFAGNVVSSANDTSEYENAAVGAQSWDAGASVTIKVSNNQIACGGATTADGVYIGDIPAGKPLGSITATITNNLISGWQHGINLVSSVASATISGNTIQNNIGTGSGIHIEAAVTATNVHVNFNNIVGNTGTGVYGVSNKGTSILDAENNWWDDASGPSGVGPGSGDAVSVNVDFTPWLTAPIAAGGVKSETVTGRGTVDARDEADTTVDIDAAGGHTVTVASLASNPGTGFAAGKGSIGKYVDVNLDNVAGVTQVEIHLYYTDAEVAGLDESSLKMYYWTGATWAVCSNTGINTVANYVWAIISATTTPNLDFLLGGPLGGGGNPKPPPSVGGEVYPVDKLALLTPYIAAILVVATTAVVVKRRRH